VAFGVVAPGDLGIVEGEDGAHVRLEKQNLRDAKEEHGRQAESCCERSVIPAGKHVST
jgi:hypothetical protein